MQVRVHFEGPANALIPSWHRAAVHGWVFRALETVDKPLSDAIHSNPNRLPSPLLIAPLYSQGSHPVPTEARGALRFPDPHAELTIGTVFPPLAEALAALQPDLLPPLIIEDGAGGESVWTPTKVETFGPGGRIAGRFAAVPPTGRISVDAYCPSGVLVSPRRDWIPDLNSSASTSPIGKRIFVPENRGPFEDRLTESLQNRLVLGGFAPNLVNGMRVEWLETVRKIIIPFPAWNVRHGAHLGRIRIHGPKLAVLHALDIGIGNLTAAGFGLALPTGGVAL